MTGEIEQKLTKATKGPLFPSLPSVKIKLPGLRPYDPRDLIEYSARHARIRNWLWLSLLFFLTR